MVVSEITSVLWVFSAKDGNLQKFLFTVCFHYYVCSYLWCSKFGIIRKGRKLELNTFGENLCQNCTVVQRIKYLAIVLKKLLAMTSVGQSVNWSNNFAFGLAGAIMSFGFNLTVTVLRICYTNRINKRFKRWEESEELKFLRKLERMQFPPTADYEMTILPERW